MNNEEYIFSDLEKTILDVINLYPHQRLSLNDLSHITHLSSRIIYRSLGELEARGILKVLKNGSERITGFKLKESELQ